MKGKVFTTPPATVEISKYRIRDEFDNPLMVRSAVRARYAKTVCIDSGGRHVEGNV